jgi:hypothetical protein
MPREALLPVALVLWACSVADEGATSGAVGATAPAERPLAPGSVEPVGPAEPAIPVGVQADAGTRVDGFVELSPLEYSLVIASSEGDAATADGALSIELTAPAARLFYRYAAAGEGPAESRLCVVFNGGPGVGSQALWTALGPDTSAPLHRLCHVLFIDARNAGLSYQQVDNPKAHESSFAEYNAYVDAADTLRALASVLPELAPTELETIVLVGESYGGVRASLMLSMIHSARSAALPFSAALLDDDLERLSAHFGRELDWLFTRQVLLQPTLAGRLQDALTGEILLADGSKVWQLAAELQRELPACPDDCAGFSWMIEALQVLGRSPYDTRASARWLDEQFERTTTHANGDLFDALVRAPPDGLRAGQRSRAFRSTRPIELPTDDPAWSARWGALGEHDRYFVAFNPESYAHFTSPEARALAADAFEPSYAQRFLDTLPLVDTFITRAEYDLVNLSAAIPLSLESFPSVVSVVLEELGTGPRPGQWAVAFADGTQARIRAPHYLASHSVALDRASELVDDLRAWFDSSR